MNQLILSFGGNIGDVPGIFEKALVMLIEALHGDLLKKSSLYKTEPLYDRAQPWFWNMAAILETPVTATDALNICLETEN
ncbi:MAG TPA: 2-amino-4-hydroxy-6-hydroxymethyldihydropteridine diphosphokinase, partial [Candidatus Marinimicrobia bacterium]|nr:2-amino-4-hydroxy-6-hydroxymethyldihydropteridine diphosphokinase [Candidatus Neomarinimicrobiota bacterium]